MVKELFFLFKKVSLGFIALTIISVIFNGCGLSSDIRKLKEGTIKEVGSMVIPRLGVKAVNLANEEVLVCGAVPHLEFIKTTTISSEIKKIIDEGNLPCEIYNPQTETFRLTGKMIKERSNYGMAPLANGNVIIIGGVDGEASTKALKLSREERKKKGIFVSNPVKAPSVEIYNFQTGQFERGPKLNVPKLSVRSTILKNGDVFAIGNPLNRENKGYLGRIIEIFRADKGVFEIVTNTPVECLFHASYIKTLPNGNVYLRTYVDPNEGGSGIRLKNCDVAYSPFKKKFKVLPSTEKVERRFNNFSVSTLDNEHIFISGGRNIKVRKSNYKYNFLTGELTKVSNFNIAREAHGLIQLKNKKILTVGGVPNNFTDALKSLELYDPKSNKMVLLGNLKIKTFLPRLLLMKNGEVLIFEHTDEDGHQNVVEKYTPKK